MHGPDAIIDPAAGTTVQLSRTPLPRTSVRKLSCTTTNGVMM
jgi:hypothetical protein